MEELDLKEIFNLFWSKKISIILIVLILTIIGTIYTYGFVTPVYNSSTTLVLAKTESQNDKKETAMTTSDITLNSKLVSTYSELVKSKKVLREVISNVGINIEEEALRKNIKVSSVKDTELIEITVTNKDAEVAAKIANETAKVFTKNVAEIYNLNNIHVVDQAEVASTPSNNHHIRNIIIFAVIGVVISVVYVLLVNMLDTTVKSAEDVEKILEGTPVLASVPKYDFSEIYEMGGEK